MYIVAKKNPAKKDISKHGGLLIAEIALQWFLFPFLQRENERNKCSDTKTALNCLEIGW